jgi:aminoglycoside phosphotransferase (APT) family kinase protein
MRRQVVERSLNSLLRDAGWLRDEHILIESVSGGVINDLYRISCGSRVLYAKRTTAPSQMRLRYVPHDFLLLMTADRLSKEKRAMEACAAIWPTGMVPEIVRFDAQSQTLVMTDVAGPGGMLLEDVFADRINEPITEHLASAASLLALARPTPPPIRYYDDERTARAVKLKYSYLLPCMSLVYADRDAELLADVRNFYRTSVAIASALSHGDFHPRNMVIRTDDSIGIVDYEEAMLHDPVYDVSVLAASYILWSIRRPDMAGRLEALTLLLLDMFRAALGVSGQSEQGTILDYRIKNYIAGAMMDRSFGISRTEWLKDQDCRDRVKQAAKVFLSSGRLGVAEVLRCLA